MRYRVSFTDSTTHEIQADDDVEALFRLISQPPYTELQPGHIRYIQSFAGAPWHEVRMIAPQSIERFFALYNQAQPPAHMRGMVNG